MDTTSYTDSQAAVLAAQFPIVCKYYSNNIPLNPSSHYQYANNPGIRCCSSSQRLAVASPTKPPLFCDMSPVTMSTCIFYSSDFKILKKIKASNQTVYFMTRYRTEQESYIYKLYGEDAVVYLELNYSDIKSIDDNIDTEAIRVFEDFIVNELGFTFDLQEIDEECLDRKLQNTTNSFFKAILT